MQSTSFQHKWVIDAHRHTDRSRIRRHDADPEKGVRLVVVMANKAAELANRLLNGTEISECQQHLLETATRLAAASAKPSRTAVQWPASAG